MNRPLNSAPGGEISPTRCWDIAIAGGGMVGLALALALDTAARGRRRILVVEKAALPPAGTVRPAYRSGFDARSTALSRGSELILRDIGVWSELQQHLASIQHIHVSQRGRAGMVDLDAAQHGWPALGHVVENAWLGAVLLAAVRQRPAIELRGGQQLGALRIEAESVAMRCAGDPIQARLLCITDGAESALAASLGMHSERHAYQRSALIANIASERSHANRAYERFTDSGPLAMLPLPDHAGQHRSALVWSLTPARAETLRAMPDGDFLAALQQIFGYRLGRLLATGERSCYPLVRSTVREQCRRNVVVMGNAAHALHPVAGQGFNLALRDVAALASLLADVPHPGDLSVLQEYYRQRAPDQGRTVAFSHYLPALFGLSRPGLGALRGLGLTAMGLLPSPRRAFVELAAGCGPGAVTRVAGT